MQLIPYLPFVFVIFQVYTLFLLIKRGWGVEAFVWAMAAEMVTIANLLYNPNRVQVIIAGYLVDFTLWNPIIWGAFVIFCSFRLSEQS